MSNEFADFLWQFRRPLGRLGGVFASAAGEFSEDRQLVERVVGAYRTAIRTDVGTTNNIWLEHFAGINAETHRVLASGDIDRATEILRNPEASDLFFGFDGPTSIDRKNAEQEYTRTMLQWYAYDALTSLAEALGAVNVENPEATRTTTPISADALLDAIDGALGVRVAFPNPFQGEMGIQTTRGIVSHRAAMALYQAWRIFDLVGKNPDARIVEIGAGLGRNAYFAHQLGSRNYTIVDLPTTNIAQGYFLGRTLGADAVRLHGEERAAYATVMPSEPFFNGAGRYDLVANIDSMTEFSEGTAMAYVEQIAARSSAFLSINHEANHFRIRDVLARVRPGLKTTRTPSWIRQGYVEEVAVF